MATTDPDPAGEFDMEILASAIARHLASPAAYASPATLGTDLDAIASAIAYRLAPLRLNTEALASAIAQRLASPARVRFPGAPAELAASHIDIEALASQVARRLGDSQADTGSLDRTIEALASAVTRRLTEPAIIISQTELEGFVSRVAAAIQGRMAPTAPSEGTLKADTVDASEALQREDEQGQPPDSAQT